MTNIAPIFTWATWWKSDDRFVWIVNSFQESKNIDIRTNPRGIKLNKALQLDNSVDELITKIIKVSNWTIIAFWENGWIYKKINNIWSKNTNWLWSKVLDAVEFNWNVYVTTSTKLYRQSVSTINNDVAMTEYQTLQNCIYHPLFNAHNGFLYVWNKDKVDYIENTANAYMPDILTMNSLVKVKYFDMIWWNIKVYTEFSDEDRTDVLFFDWFSNEILESFSLKWIILEQKQNKQGIDYIISNNQLWLIDWYNTITLKNIDNYSKNFNSITVKWNRLLFWWTWWLREWWALNKNYPEVLSFSYTVSWWDDSEIWAIQTIWDDLYVSWKNWNNYGIDKLSNNYYSSWYWISRVYYWNYRGSEKESNFLQTVFNKIQWTDNIKIYYRINLETNWTLLDTYDINSDTENKFHHKKYFAWAWNFIEFKVELNSSWTTTPELFELFLWFNDIKQWQ